VSPRATIFAGLSVLAAFYACNANHDRSTHAATQNDAPTAAGNAVRPPDADAAPRAQPAAIVRFDTGANESPFVHAEVVSTPRDVHRGLMYRQYLPADEGMLFIMGHERRHTFWMKNTLIPLDIIFITRDMKVAGIIHDAQPMDQTSRGVGKPSLYVLEVNGGWTVKHGVKDDNPVVFENVALP